MTRERQADGTFKHDYYLSNAAPEPSLKELARVSKAAHRIEECLERQGGGGLGRLPGEELDRLASSPDSVDAGRVVPESGARRGKNPDPGADAAATEAVDRGPDRETPRHERPLIALPPGHTLVASKRTSPAVPPPIS